MALNPAKWLIDKSALTRFGKPPVYKVLLPRVRSGLVARSIVTELEVGFSARNTAGYRTAYDEILDFLPHVFVNPQPESRARDVQAELVNRGQHRAISPPDLLIAAVAEAQRLTVLHYDADFDLVAEITGQPTEWVVPRGTVD